MIALLRALPLAWRLAAWLGALAVIGGAYWAWHHHVYQRGYAAAMADVAARNKEAGDEADRVRLRIRACRNAGGLWDQQAGECRWP